MNIELMKQKAMELQQEFEIPAETWQKELEKIWKANKQVKRWQLIMQRTFGKPQFARPGETWQGCEVGKIFTESPER